MSWPLLSRTMVMYCRLCNISINPSIAAASGREAWRRSEPRSKLGSEVLQILATIVVEVAGDEPDGGVQCKQRVGSGGGRADRRRLAAISLGC